MHIIIGLSLGLILVGLLMTYLRSGIQQPVLNTIVYWVGIIMIVIGLVLLLTPVLVWLNVQLRSMIGAN